MKNKQLVWYCEPQSQALLTLTLSSSPTQGVARHHWRKACQGQGAPKRTEPQSAFMPPPLYVNEKPWTSIHSRKACNMKGGNLDKQQKDRGRNRKFKGAKIFYKEIKKQLFLMSLEISGK